MRNINNIYNVQKEIKNDDFLISYVVKEIDTRKKYIFYLLRNDIKFDQYVSYVINKFNSIKNLNFENMVNLVNVIPITTIDGNKLEKMQYGYIVENYDYKFNIEKYIDKCTVQEKIMIFMEICSTVNTLNINGYVFNNLDLSDIKYVSIQDGQAKIKIKNILENEIKKINLYSSSAKLQPFPYNIENGRLFYSDLDNLDDLYLLFKKIFFKQKDDFMSSEIYQINKFFSMLHASNNRCTISTFIKTMNNELNKKYDVYKECNVDKIKTDIDIIGREEEIKIVERDYRSVLSNRKNNSFLCFMGDNGSGKSCFLNKINNLIENRYCKKVLYLRNRKYYENKNTVTIFNEVFAKFDLKIISKYEKYIMTFIDCIMGRCENISEIEQYKLINRVTECIKESSRESLVVILIDDLESVPEIIRKCVFYFFSSDVQIENIMIVFTSNQSLWNEKFSQYISDIKKICVLEQYTLNYFNQYNTKKMISNILGYGKSVDEISMKIYNVTFGNPQYILSIITELYNSKKLFFNYDEEEWQYKGDFNQISITAEMQSKINKMIDGLDEMHIKILELLSVFSMPLPEDLIFKFITNTNNEILFYKDLKAERFFSDKISDSGFLVGFANDLLRNILYLKLDNNKKQELHKAASMLLENEVKCNGMYAEEFLYHLSKTNNNKKLYTYAKKYAESAYKHGNEKEAIQYYQLCLKYCDKNEKSDIAIKIAKLFENISNHEKSFEYFKRANKYACSINDEKLKIYTLLEILIIRMNESYNYSEDMTTSLKAIRKQLDNLNYVKGEIFYYYALMLRSKIKNEYDNIIEYGNKALKLSIGTNKNEDVCGWILNTLAWVYLRRNSRDTAKLMMIRSTNIFYKNNNKNGYLFSKNAYTELVSDEKCDYENSIQKFSEIERISNKEGFCKREIVAIVNIAMCYIMLKNYKKAEEYFFKSIQRQKEENVDFYSKNTYEGLCLLYVLSENNKMAIRYHKLSNSIELLYDTGLNKRIEDYVTEYNYYKNFCDYDKAYIYIKEIYKIVSAKQDNKSIRLICEYYLFLLKISKDSTEAENIYNMLYDNLIKLRKNEEKMLIRLTAISIIANNQYIKFAEKLFEKLKCCPINYNLEAYYIYLEFMFGKKENYSYLINKALRVCNLQIHRGIRSKLYECIADKYMDMNCFELALQYYYESINIHKNNYCNLSYEEAIVYLNNSGFLGLYKKIVNCIKKKMKIKINFKQFTSIDSIEDFQIINNEINLERLMLNNSVYTSMQKLYEKLYYNDLSDVYDLFSRFEERVLNNLENVIKYLARVTLCDKAVLISENTNGINEIICNYRFSNVNIIENLTNAKLEGQEKVTILKKDDIFVNQGTEGYYINANSIKACFYMKLRNNETYMNEASRVNAKLILISSNAVYNINEHSKRILEKFEPFILFLLEKYNLTINSTLDKLTGCYNRKYFSECLMYANEFLKNTKEAFGVIMFDIDDFKGVNDKFGHQTGDEVLINVVREAEKCISPNDIIGRYGGEEFLILVQNTNREKIMSMAEKIRKGVDAAKLLGSKRKVTISIGVTLVEEKDLSSDIIIGHVDEALYKSKNTGKNRVTFWDEKCSTNNEVKDMGNTLFMNDARNYKMNLVISDILNLIKENYSKDEKMRTLLNELIMTTNSQSGGIYLVDNDTIKKELVLDKTYIEEKEKVLINEMLIQKAVDDKKSIAMIDWDSIDYNDRKVPNWYSVCIAPIIFNGKVIAVLYLSDYINNREFNNNDCVFLSSLGQLSIPIFL